MWRIDKNMVISSKKQARKSLKFISITVSLSPYNNHNILYHFFKIIHRARKI